MNQTGEIIGVLEEVVCILDRPDTDVAWSRYNNVAEAVSDLSQHIALLRSGDISRIEDLASLFAPSGSLQEISITSGWGERFLCLAAWFDRAIESIRPK